MELDPESLDDRDRYGFLISAVVPRPIAWVSTADKAGRPNLAPFSFFTGVTAKPMTLCFAPANARDGKKKDTLLNIEETGEFVVNAVPEALAARMVITSADFDRGVDEFAEAGLTPRPSFKVKPPYVAESPVQMECVLDRVVRVGEGPLGGNLVLGRVVHLRVADAVWKDGKLDHRDWKPLGRLEASWYAGVRESFELARPRKP